MNDASLLIAIQRRYNGDIMDYISNLATSFILGVPFRWKSGITLVLSCNCQKSGCRIPSIYPQKFNENAAHLCNWWAKKLAALPCFSYHLPSMEWSSGKCWKVQGQTESWLVVDLPLWKIWKSIGMMISFIWKNRKCSKPNKTRELCFHGNWRMWKCLIDQWDKIWWASCEWEGYFLTMKWCTVEGAPIFFKQSHIIGNP